MARRLYNTEVKVVNNHINMFTCMTVLLAIGVQGGRQLGTAYPMDGSRVLHRCHVGPQDRRVDAWRADVG